MLGSNSGVYWRHETRGGGGGGGVTMIRLISYFLGNLNALLIVTLIRTKQWGEKEEEKK